MSTPLSPHVDTYCVIGHPIGHSLSPWIHARFAQLLEQNLQYTQCLAPLDGFAHTLAELTAQGLKGCNVTVPFKQQAAQLAHACSPRVSLAQAANTLHIHADGRIDADNTDGLGLVRDIEVNANFCLSGKRILLLGAGGAAAGSLACLIEAKPTRITIVNRTIERAQTLLNTHAQLAQECGVQLEALSLTSLTSPATTSNARYDVLINATATSLQGQALNLPEPNQLLHFGALVYDMMYGPAAKPFLDWSQSQAQTHAITARDGLGMLVEQAAEAFLLWRGVRPDSPLVLRELRQHLIQLGKA